ncbi:Rad2 family DNA repair protein [Companilactobacillus jidongensis]|uniref:hypothetical protein n=1 Tax=Companilactobacillus jidongensis TaxID=2486006 RepID=UPI000F76B619|nr:hypothetical protein [Companilactobacillus jidongensis]
MVISYTPPTDSDPNNAKLTYTYNDKTLAGYRNSTDTGQHEVSKKNLNLSLSNLGLKKGDPLRFGFTGANGADGNQTETNTVVFETIPSIVDADANAYVVDKTNKTKISSSTDVMDDTDKSYNDATSVHPNDDLQFNYMLRYNSGKQSMNPITAVVGIPSNITISKDDNDYVGKVVYSDNSSENIPASAISTDGKQLTFKLKNGLSTTLPTAKIELNAKANEVPDATSALTVDTSHASLESTNYKTDTQTPTFNIQEPQDTLTIAKTSVDPATSYDGKTINLTGNMKFKNQSTIDNNDMDIYYSIDGGKAVDFKDTASANGNFTIPFSSTVEGKHTIDVQVVDSSYVSSDGTKDVISSNKLTYTVNVKAVSLVATADTSPITVLNNTSVAMPGITIGHNDGSSLEDGSDPTVNYTVSNSNYNSGQAVSGEADSLQIGQSGSQDTIYFNMNKAVDDSTAGLRVGENTINVTITDPGGHVSNTLKFVINVQDINPALSYGDGTDGNITVVATDDSVSLPITVAYDGTTEFKPSDLTWSMTVDKKAVSFSKLDSSTNTTSYDFTKSFTRAELGIDKDSTSPTHTIVIKATDPYGRVSNEQTYTLKMVYSSASITYDNSYSFGEFNQSPEARVIKRTSDWDIGVKTVDSPYLLTADASSLTTNDSNNNQTLAGGLIYVDPNTGTNKPMTDPVTLGENDSDTTGNYGISSGWKSDQGILLQVDPNALAGSYSGKINWILTDSVN